MVAIALIMILGLSTCAASLLSDKPTSTGDDPATQRMGAQSACESMVKDRLKAPATADFTGVTTTGAGPWTTTGSVDSQNSFGAQIRSSFRCELRLEGEYFKGSVKVS